MRDIRDELTARRQNLIARYGDALHAFDVGLERLHRDRREAITRFEAEKATLDHMLAMEDQHQAEGELPPTAAGQRMGFTLKDFIKTKVRVSGPIDKEALQAAALEAGLSDGGRSFNMTLQNVASGGGIKKLPDGRYADGRSSENLFGIGGTTEEAPMIAQ